MSISTYAGIGPRNSATPQTERMPGEIGKRQVENNAGGFTFAIDDWKRLERFLILGSEGGTFYVGERKLTKDNAACVQRCIDADGLRVVRTIVEISDAGRAPKNDPALLALAMCFASKVEEVRKAAALALPKVARIGTHLFHFHEFVQQFRGHGRVLNRALRNWYLGRSAKDLALQVAKYQQRDGWAHRDLLRLCKPKPQTAEQSCLLRWAVGKPVEGTADQGEGAAFLQAVECAKTAPRAKDVASLIRNFNLPRECVPTQWLNDPEVWAALLERMPLHAMVRNLGKMTAIELLKPLGNGEQRVVTALADVEQIRKSRLHPLSILIALRQYAQGHGDKGSLRWRPSQRIIDALDRAFGLAFSTIEPTGKRFYLGVDVSGSMDCCGIAGSSVTPREGAAALAMQIARTEQRYVMRGFASGGSPYSNRIGGKWGGDPPHMVDLGVTAKDSLAVACEKARAIPMGGTDCALPMLDAMAGKLDVDCFVVLTDNETWAGSVHPVEALRQYRKQSGIPAKMVVIGMTATEISIADPEDAGSLDVVGFDASVPALLAEFVKD